MPKTDLHPQYFPEAAITCTCGATYVMGSTKDALRVDLCSNCHPFYSGNQKLIDTAGRVDRFREKMATAESMQSKTKKATKAEAPKTDVKEEKTEEVTPEVVEEPTEEVETNEETPSEEGSDGEATTAGDDESSEALAVDDAGKEA